jgi:hypothetical protein
MNIYVTRPLNPMFNCAVQTITKRVWPQWFDQGLEAPNSFRALKYEFQARGRITVYDGGCSNTIFDDPDINVMFRAWHDWCHLKGNYDFRLVGEMQAAYMQMEHVVTLYGDGETGQQLCALIDAEVIGQAQYYQLHTKYVQNQRAFVEAYIGTSDKRYVIEQEW